MRKIRANNTMPSFSRGPKRQARFASESALRCAGLFIEQVIHDRSVSHGRNARAAKSVICYAATTRFPFLSPRMFCLIVAIEPYVGDNNPPPTMTLLSRNSPIPTGNAWARRVGNALKGPTVAGKSSLSY